MGKTGKNKVYSAEFKIGVIMDMREHHLGYRETVQHNTGDGSLCYAFARSGIQVVCWFTFMQ